MKKVVYETLRDIGYATLSVALLYAHSISSYILPEQRIDFAHYQHSSKPLSKLLKKVEE
ncbi:MAG: hypothetical protein RL557_635 [archaeon]|jgi:hypothetical protein